MSRGRIVYSTGPDGSRSSEQSKGPGREPTVSRAAGEHDVGVRREKSGRRGKTVTVSGPFFLVRNDAAKLLKALKQSCGGGGTLKPSDRAGEPAFDLEIQGDHVERLVDTLGKQGYRVKKSGG